MQARTYIATVAERVGFSVANLVVELLFVAPLISTTGHIHILSIQALHEGLIKDKRLVAAYEQDDT